MKRYSVEGEGDSIIYRVPYGNLGIMASEGAREMGTLVDRWISAWRQETLTLYPALATLSPEYLKSSYLVRQQSNRFATGEGKVVIKESVRNSDLFLLSDIGNYNCSYPMYGRQQPMSPDDHFMDIIRTIGAISGKARRISVIMPLLYEGRQHKRTSRESLDCALALQELERMGVANIITFDAHDPRVSNAIPLCSFENINPCYQLLKAMVLNEENLSFDKDHLTVVSPDEGGLQRNIYYASLLGLNVSMFYKRRDYTRLVNGKNPIISHEYLGDNLEGKDVIIVDDLISSGDSSLDVAKELKKRNAGRIFIMVTYAQFTMGLEKFNEAHADGIISRVYATNLTYRTPELLSAPWFFDVDMSKFMAFLIETLNHDQSLSPLIDPSAKIRRLMSRYRKGKPTA